MSKCYAVQHSDQMVCERCYQSWDVNDVCEPECKPVAAHATLRDQFAMAALPVVYIDMSDLEDDSAVAIAAYAVADAMLKERVK